MSIYAEHEKLAAIRDKSQAIGEFLDKSGYQLAEWVEGHGLYKENELVPVRKPIQDVLARYFGIDRDKIELEKVAMLNELREAQR